MDLILRNALIAGEESKPPVDIGIEGGRIAAIEAGLTAEGERSTSGGALSHPGSSRPTFISTNRACSTAVNQ